MFAGSAFGVFLPFFLSILLVVPAVHSQTVKGSTSIVPDDIWDLIEEEIEREVRGEVEEFGIGGDLGGTLTAACLRAGAKLCKVYCAIQKDHSASNCLNGFLWVNGCLDHVEEFCNGGA